MSEGKKNDEGKLEGMYTYMSAYPLIGYLRETGYQDIYDLRNNLNIAYAYEKVIETYLYYKKLPSIRNIASRLEELLSSIEVIDTFEREMSSVCKLGASKYGYLNYQKGLDPNRILNALGRHLIAYFLGEATDLESGVSHLAHAIANIHMLMYYSGKELTLGVNNEE